MIHIICEINEQERIKIMSKEITLDELVELFSKNKRLSKKKVINALIESGKVKDKTEAESTINRVKLNKEINELLDEDICCPHCQSKKIRKKGYNPNGLLRYQCKECKKTFNVTTNTIFDGSKYSLDIWQSLIEEMMYHHPIDEIIHSFGKKYPHVKFKKNTLLTMRIKIMDLVSQIQDRYFLEHPFKGTIYMDEKFFKENQLGVTNKNMYNPYPEDRIRRSRRKGEPMEYGVMTFDFSNVLCIVDKDGRAYGKLITMGRTTEEVFNEYFLPIIDIPNVEMVCTDAQKLFVDFCKENHLTQCVTPSNYYNEMIKLNDILDEEKKEKRMYQLYQQGRFGYLIADGKQFSYEDFRVIVSMYSLRLDRVNQLHGDLENTINRIYKSVPTKNLNGYVSWICFLKNWKNLYGAFDNSTASKIMKYLLKEHVRMTTEDLKNKSIANIPKPKKKDFQTVKTINKKGEEVYYNYKLNPEHNYNNNKRKIIDNLTTEQMKDLCRYCKIKGFSMYNRTGLKQLLKSQKNFQDMYISYMAFIEKELHEKEDTMKEIKEQQLKNNMTLKANSMKGLTVSQAIALAGKTVVTPKYNDTKQGKTLFIDTETTGVNYGQMGGVKDEVLSICILDRFRTVLLKCYVKPIRHKDWPDAEKVNGLSPQFIATNGISHDEFKKKLKPLMTNANEIIAYNNQYDIYMLKEFIEPSTFKKLVDNSINDNPNKCCMIRYSAEHGNSKWVSLSKACSNEGIAFEGSAHGAEADVKACYDLWMKMYPKYFD